MKKIEAILAIFLAVFLFLSVSVVYAQPNQSETDCQISNVNLNGQGTHLEIEPGGSIEISLDYQVWSRIGCPTCKQQIVVGIEREPLFCAYNGEPGIYPGTKGQSRVTITAPTEPGTYTVRWLLMSWKTCEDAKDMYRKCISLGYGMAEITVTDSGDSGPCCEVELDLNGQGNYLEIESGEAIRMSIHYKIRAGNNCPSDKQQIVIGLNRNPLYCAYNGIPNTYPDITDGNVLYEITAPTEPGIYNVRWVNTFEYTCHNAKDKYRESDYLGYVAGKIKVTKSDKTGICAKVTNVDLNNQGNYLEIMTGETFSVSLDYQVWCWVEGGHRRQIMIGIDDDAFWCVYDGIPPEYPGLSRHDDVTIRIPEPGTYTLSWMVTFCDSVGDSRDFFKTRPDLREKIGTIKVTKPDDLGICCKVSNINLNNQGNYLEVMPDQTFVVGLDYQFCCWTGNNARRQIIVGVDDKPFWCVYDGIPPEYPGFSLYGITLTEIEKPGTYNLMWMVTFCDSPKDGMDAYRSHPDLREKIGTIKVTKPDDWKCIHHRLVEFADKYKVPDTNISFWQKGNDLRVQIDDYGHWDINSGYVSISVNESVDIDYNSAKVYSKIGDYKEIDSKIGIAEKTILFAVGLIPLIGTGYGTAKFAQEITDPPEYNWHVSNDCVPDRNLYSEEYFDTNDMLNSQDIVRIPWHTLSAESIRIECPDLDFPNPGTHIVVFCVDYCVNAPGGITSILGKLKIRYDVALPIKVGPN